MKKTSAKPTSRAAVRRGPGRPGRESASATEITKEVLIMRALELTRKEPLQDISMLRLAREFGVTPGLIHYYLHGINRLLSGVINLYNRRLTESFPVASGNWRDDIERQFTTAYNFMIEYSGITAYIVAHNRFRLIQEVAPDEVDYGIVRFETVSRTFRDAGFAPDDAAMNLHLITQFTMSCAHAFSLRQLPSEHESYLTDQLSKFSPKQAPGICFIRKSFVRMDADKVFRRGLTIHLDGFQVALDEKLNKSSSIVTLGEAKRRT